MTGQDEKYMQMALRLAKRGIGNVEPNPAVGCVILKANQIIGKGWHQKFGSPHAEINALQDCKTLAANPRGATMYVTLEPCCHQGKTGPCTQAIIHAKLAKVIIATIDPSEHARGKGIQQLRSAGIEVQTGLCQNEAKLLNAPFIKFARTGRCWVTLKWAQSIDGKLAYADHDNQQKWISNRLSRKDVHKLRRRVDAILVGINTVIADNPLLTARPSKGKKPLRIVLDSYLRTPLTSRLLKTAKKNPVLILTGHDALTANPQIVEKITHTGAEILAYPDTQGRSNLYFLLEQLLNRRITRLLVEGGPTVIASFLKEQLADEFFIYISPTILGPQGSADLSTTMAKLAKGLHLHHLDVKRLGDDVRLTGLSEKTLNELSIC